MKPPVDYINPHATSTPIGDVKEIEAVDQVYVNTAYTLGKFGRDEYVRMALRNRAPILPFVTVGSAEIYPIIGRLDWNWFKRYTEWPFFPVTNPVPLPTKWSIYFGKPISVEEYAERDAENFLVVQRLAYRVREEIQQTLQKAVLRRKSVFV